MLSMFPFNLHLISSSLFSFSSQFRDLALGVLEQCYRENDMKTWQLITYELKNWSDWTCLSLAVISHHQEFVAHKCCQMILNDLWMGGMSIRRYLNWKVIASILFFPLVLRIEFKSVEELKLQPKTHEEHLATQEDSDLTDDDIDEDNSGTFSNEFAQNRSKEDYPIRTSSHRKNETLVEFILENQNIENESIEMASMNKSINDRPSSPSKRTMSFSIPPTEDVNDISIETTKKTEDEDLPQETSSIPLTQRFYEFYNAPITKFWYNAIFYLLFLFFFTYMVLVRTPPRPNIAGKRTWIFVSRKRMNACCRVSCDDLFGIIST